MCINSHIWRTGKRNDKNTQHDLLSVLFICLFYLHISEKQNPSVILDRFTMKIDQTVEIIESELDFWKWRFCYKTVHVYLFRHCSEKGSSYPVRSFPKRVWKLGATPIGVKYIWIFITIIYRRRWAGSFSGRKAINFGRKWPVLFFHSVRTLVRRPISPWSIYCKTWLYFTDKYEFTDRY